MINCCFFYNVQTAVSSAKSSIFIFHSFTQDISTEVCWIPETQTTDAESRQVWKEIYNISHPSKDTGDSVRNVCCEIYIIFRVYDLLEVWRWLDTLYHTVLYFPVPLQLGDEGFYWKSWRDTCGGTFQKPASPTNVFECFHIRTYESHKSCPYPTFGNNIWPSSFQPC